MELKGRLKLIADKVPMCDTMCDIGTDHGYLPIYLIEKHKCKKAIAADVKKGPIEAAQNNIEMYKMNEAIQTRLGDGLGPIGVKEVDIIVIAGMGGILIKDILERGLDTAKNARSIILQPMNALEILREWLYKNGFEISDEELINEGEKIYDVICIKWTGSIQKVESFNYFLGQKLIEKKDPLLNKYMEKWSNQLKKAILEMEEADEKVNNIRKKYLYLIENMDKVKIIIDKHIENRSKYENKN